MTQKFETGREFTQKFQEIEEKYGQKMAETGEAILRAVADGGKALVELPESIVKGRKLEREVVGVELDEDELTALRKKIVQL